MIDQLLDFISGTEVTGDIQKDILLQFSAKGLDEIAEHSIKVANEAKSLAKRFGVSEEKAYTAGLLHDIGNIIPHQKRVGLCNELGIEVLEEEKLAPSMLHSKLSGIIARELYKVDDDICDAIECHSTLKAYAGKLDLTLFVADKTSWPGAYNEGFIKEMLEGLNVSLEHSAIKFLEYILDGHAAVIHPKAIESYNYLKDKCK